MRDVLLAGSILGFLLSTFGFISNWTASHYGTYYTPTMNTLTRVYGGGMVVCVAVGVWAGFFAKRS